MKSIRFFLIAVLFSVVAVVMFIAMLAGYQRSLQQTQKIFDMELEEKYQLLDQVLTHIQNNRRDIDFISTDLFLHQASTQTKTLFQIVDPSGKVLLQSGDYGEKTLLPLREGKSSFNFMRYRWQAHVQRASHSPVWIIVAERDDLRFVLADRIITDIIKPILIGLLCIIIFVWLIVRAGFRPIEKLANAIKEKSASDLSKIAVNDIPEELGPISHSVNQLFDRLSTSFEREKRFTADAAHEMRNPITALKIHIDNLLEESDGKNESILKIKQAIDRLSNLVEQLLILHRMSPEQYAASFSCVDLYAVASDMIQELYPQIEKKSQTIELQGEHCGVTSDLFGMEVLLKNLIDNAVKYTPEGGQILVSISNHNGFSIRVEDSGSGIPEAERNRVMDRFYRVGGDRHTSKIIGSGLGLSIVKHIADLHQANISLQKSTLGGLLVEICFPAYRHCDSTTSANEN